MRRKPTWHSRLRYLWHGVIYFFERVPGALKGHLNTEELIRVAVASLTAGGGLFGLLNALTLSTATIFPAPTDAAVAATALTLILEAVRRLGHGSDVASIPPRPRKIR